MVSLADELKKLEEMRNSGALSEQEFQAAKHLLLYPRPEQGQYQDLRGPGFQHVPRYPVPHDPRLAQPETGRGQSFSDSLIGRFLIFLLTDPIGWIILAVLGISMCFIYIENMLWPGP